MRYSSSRIQQETRLESVDYLIHMVDIGRLDPNPAFGSLPNLSLVKRSHIVESLILGLPVEMIWAEQDALGKTQLLSGFEVVSSILDFNSNSFPLRKLRILKHLEGLRFSNIDFAEQKHFMQMEVALGTIHYDSDPMLKCLFVESINKDKYGVDASQIARSIIFKKAYYTIDNYIEHISKYFNEDAYAISSRKKYERYKLKLQAEILLCLLVIYIGTERNRLNRSFSTESYSYSRSHISNYDDVYIYFSDDISTALNKIMFMIEMDDLYLNDCFKQLDNIVYDAFRSDKFSMDSIGKSFSYSSHLRKSELSLVEYVIYSFSGYQDRIRIDRFSSVGDLVDRLM
ncbi:hypothetical protein J4H27_14115 [Vibrio alginolyticus]|uniref:hypothetical protein n=1 Tax=Vibrio TaxID=662 RepID=UPI001BD5E0D5|nr:MULTISPECIES: hypothetical protein [Vibrio]ELA6640201.1 hypothetical protein [Vibrio alginolyticus]MBS9943108.1 hypothetical protein [Vibrio alginolyticus]